MTQKTYRNEAVMHVATGSNGAAESLSLDAQDQLVLTLARHLFLSPDTPEHPAWRSAHRLAMLMLPVDDAALVVNCLWRIIQRLQLVRQSEFLFVKLDDPHAHIFLTREERNLIQLLHFLRIEESAGAQAQLLLLCQGGDGQSLLLDAKRLSAVFRGSPETV